MFERFDSSPSARRLRELQIKQPLTDGEKIECEILLRKKYFENTEQEGFEDGIYRGRKTETIARDTFKKAVEEKAVDERRDQRPAAEPDSQRGRNTSPLKTSDLEFKSEDVLGFLSKMRIKHEAFHSYVNRPQLKEV